MKSLFFCLAVVFFVQIVFGQEKRKEFAIYLLPDNIKSNRVSALNLKNLKPTGKPFIATENIESYEKETHEIQLDYIAAERLKNVQNTLQTKPFAVFVGDEAIYAGAFWTSILSNSFDGVIIDYSKNIKHEPFYSNPDFPFIALDLGYPSPKFFKGTDPRSDARIFEALEKSGRLFEPLEMLVTCRKITGTRKRHPSYIFTFAVDSVVKGKFEKPEIVLELYNDFGGAKLRQALDAFGPAYDEQNGWQFNKNKKILLKFMQQVSSENPQLRLKGFEVK